ncbi:uncharacterized protein [Mobula birostris]|uniref:uncharacterized protein isoform X1 n=2 Tax=Mobula birostris TaxID=1983395 RepID=UPI003B27F3CE
MDESETYANMRFTGADSQSPSRAEPDVSYVELNVTALSAPRVRRDGAGLSSTYAEVNCPKDEPVIGEDEAPPIAAGSRKQTTNAQTGAHEQEPKQNIGNRPYRKICLLYLLTSVLIAIVAGLSIYVSQTCQSQITSGIKYQQLWEQYQEMNRTQIQYRQLVYELNSTFESKTSENSRLNLSHRACVQSLSVLNNSISIFRTKISSFKWTKAEICHFLTSVREQTCPTDWITNKERCYYVSRFDTSFYRAKRECSNRDSRLFEINSEDETSFVSRTLYYRNGAYWIGKCEDGNAANGLLYKVSSGTATCSECKWNRRRDNCIYDKHHFICEKSAPCCPDIPERIQNLCQQPEEPT